MKKLFIIPALLSVILMSSCKKEETPTPNPTPVPTSNLSGMFSQNLNNAKQTFTINASTYSQITGQKGVQIIIPANSFKYGNGNLVTGSVTLELIEILDQKSMILMNKTTVSNGNVLVSGGQIKLTATQGSTPLFLADNASLTVMVPSDNADPLMALFDGVENSSGDIDWTPSTNDSIFTVTDSTGWDFYYFYWNNPNLGWINCDYFWNNPNPLTTVTVNFPTGYNASNTSGYLHFSSINSVAPMYWSGSSDLSSSGIPIGIDLTVVCISEISGTYYSAFVPITVVANHQVNVTLNATTLTDLQNDLDNL